jgi:hypothetical protein
MDEESLVETKGNNKGIVSSYIAHSVGKFVLVSRDYWD